MNSGGEPIMKNPSQTDTSMVEIIPTISSGTVLVNTSLAKLMRRDWFELFNTPVFMLAFLGLHATTLAADIGDVANLEDFQCIGKGRFTGAAVVPTETYGDPPGRAYAVIYFDPVHGTPLIVYGSRYRLIAPLLQSFIRRHECQHAKGVQDEIAANCAALVQMRAVGLTTEQEGQIARWHIAEGAIDPQYGGSGAAFWEQTLRCAGAR